MTATETTFCRICEALCGLEVTTEGGRVVDIKPDPAHVATGGFSCLKGLRQHKMYASPDRLRYPEERGPSGWRRVSWTDATGRIGARVRRIVDEHGPDSVAMYVGTAAGFSVLHPIFAQGFMDGIGSRSMFSSATQDCANKFAVSRAMYGFPFTLPFPDVDRTSCLIVVGANPVVSKWSFLQVPNPSKHLKAIEARGGAVFVVDPRRTESAKIAGSHVFIRPDTDVYFFLAFARELIATGGVDRSRVERFMRGFEALEALVEPWTPERCQRVTRIEASRLREMVAAYAAATARGGAAIYCSTGVNMGSKGSLAFWIAEAINAISGNLDRRGGSLVGTGVIDFPAFGKRTGRLLRTDRSRIGGLPSVNDAFPGGVLADEILTPGKGQIRALFVTGGNPLITMANSNRLRDAFARLDLLVTIDIYKNETGSLAHYVLPATSPLERADLPFLFPLMLGLQSKPYLQATRAVAEPDGEQRDEASIYLDLCRASGAPLFGSRVAQVALEALMRWTNRKNTRKPHRLPEEAILSLLLRVTGQKSFESLLRSKHGELREAHAEADFLGRRVLTDDGKVDLAPRAFVDEARARLDADFERELEAARHLKLISKRAITTHNSWTHNLPDFVEGTDKDTNHLYMHPDDAAARGLADGAIADVRTDTGVVRVPIKLLKDLMPGTVALPHGWGHQAAEGLTVASRTKGVNVNVLAADGPLRIERLSGMAHLTGFVVDVAPASGNDVTTWSGVPATG
ncbi:MAG: molybdopterin-dependent oxidoreductase [Polyangiaceae bacterium]